MAQRLIGSPEAFQTIFPVDWPHGRPVGRINPSPTEWHHEWDAANYKRIENSAFDQFFTSTMANYGRAFADNALRISPLSSLLMAPTEPDAYASADGLIGAL